MMKTDHVINLCTAIAVCSCLIGIFIGARLHKVEMQQSAIRAGVGYYNPTNANFQWITVDRSPEK